MANINALEHAGACWRCGRAVLNDVGRADTGFLNHGAAALMQGRVEADGHSSPQVATLDMRTGRASVKAHADGVEFPRVHPQWIGERARWQLCGGLKRV